MKKVFAPLCTTILFCVIFLSLSSCGKANAVPPETVIPETSVAAPAGDLPADIPSADTGSTAPQQEAAAPPPGVEAVEASILEQAGKADFDSLNKLAADAAEAGMADALIVGLEKRAALPDASPSVHVALSALYGRKGLRTKEYAALVMAEEAAKQPGVAFNIALVHGRKNLLSGSADADSFIVGTFDLETDPPGASVFLDDRSAGRTPLVLEKIKAGFHSLRFELAGYDALSVTTELGVGKTFAVSETLAAKPALLSLKVNPANAEVKIDGNTVSLEEPIALAPGTHELSIEELNGLPIAETLTVKPGESLSRSYAMEPATFKWRLNSVPAGGLISLDGKEIGTGPILDYPITAGRHRITVTLNKYEAYSETRDFYGNANPKLLYENFHLVEAPFQIPTKTIRLKNKEDWAGVEPVSMKGFNFMDNWTTVAGTAMTRAFIAQDKQYVYWLMEFSDGKPAARTGVAYAAQFYIEPGNDELHIAMKLGANMETNTFRPHLPYGPKSNTYTDMWNDAGSTTDYFIGDGYLAARFPRANLLKVLKAGTSYRLVFNLYDSGKDGKKWSGFEISKVRL